MKFCHYKIRYSQLGYTNQGLANLNPMTNAAIPHLHSSPTFYPKEIAQPICTKSIILSTVQQSELEVSYHSPALYRYSTEILPTISNGDVGHY